MINVAALDPATLALWYDPTLLGPSPGYEAVAHAVHGAIFGETEEVQSLISHESNPEVARRAAYLASTIWHEKRHFLDLILTNYGAFRVRQFISLYVNQPQVLYRAQQAGGELYVPLTAYADPVESAIAGLSDPSGIIAQVAQDIRSREDVVMDDRERGARTSWGDAIELGGHAQLEALANIFQVGSTQFLLGPQAHLDVNREIHRDDPNNTRYRWPLLLANAFGLQGFRTTDGLAAVNLAPMAAVLLATLAMRAWRQKSDDEFKRPIWPATRLLAFLEYFRDRPTALRVQNAREAWDVVNDAAKHLFGRTVVEELKVDLEFESKFVEMVVGHDAGPTDEVKTVCQEFHELRRSLIGLLEDAPEGFLDPETFAHGFLPRLQPLPVQIFPNAQSGPARGGWSRLLGFDAGPLGDGCHAVVPEHWPPERSVAFASLASWAQVIEKWASLAKLMMKGRNHRTSFGPELMRIQQLLDGWGVKVRFDPAFEFPAARAIRATSLFRVRGVDTMVCDLCKSEATQAGARLLSPWVFRSSAAGQRLFDTAYQDTAPLQRLRDWSVWVACEKCYQACRKLDLV